MLKAKRFLPLMGFLSAFFLISSSFSWAVEYKLYVPFALRETGSPSNVAYWDRFNSVIRVMNVGENGTTARIVFYDLDGNVHSQVSKDISPNATASVSLKSYFGTATFAGSAVITADQPMAGVVLQKPSWHYNRPAPISRAFSSRGENRIYLPTVLKHKWDTTTRFAVQNTSDEVVNFTLQIFDVQDQQRKKVHFEANVSPRASRHFDMGQLYIPNFSGSGSAVIHSTGTLVASAMELDTRNQRAKGFEGESRGSRNLYMPTALCQAWGSTTYYAVQNTSPTDTATVRVDYSNGATDYLTIEPRAKRSINPCVPGSWAGFSGAARMVVTSPNNANILAIGKAAGSYANSTAFHGVASGGRRVALPYVRWSRYTTGLRTYIAVQNLSNDTQGATVRFFDTSGNLRGHPVTRSVAPLQKANFTFASVVEDSYFNGSVLIEGLEGANFNVLARTAGDDDTAWKPREDYNGGVVLGALGKSIDISHHAGPITEDQVRCWVEEKGIQHIIVRASIAEEYQGANREKSKQQLETLWRAMEDEGLNFSVDLYVWLHWPNGIWGIKTPIADQVRESITFLEELDTGWPALPVKRLWIDVEETLPSGQSQAQTIGYIQEAVDACGSFPCGIYTRKLRWRDFTGNTTAFSDLPLWYALYDKNLNFNDWYYYEGSFGGWTEPAGKQYESNKEAPPLCGVDVDFNIMYLFIP